MYDYRIDLSEGIDSAKSNSCKEYIVCHYLFFNDAFEVQSSVYNGPHNLTMWCLTRAILLLSLLKGLIIVVLFMTLANLKQDRGYIWSTCQRNQYLKYNY